MKASGCFILSLAALLFWVGWAIPVSAGPPIVVGVELISPHQFPRELVLQAVGEQTGQPRSRLAIRESLDRLWSLGLFAELWVDEVPAGDGVRLRFHFARRPFIRRVAWDGDLRLSDVDLAEAANLAVGGDASPERLEQARKDLLAAYAREGYFAAQVDIRVQTDDATNGRDLACILRAGPRSRIGTVDLRGLGDAGTKPIHDTLKLEPGGEYRERTARQQVQALEDALRQEGYFEARVAPPKAVWDASTNRVNIRIDVERGPLYRVDFAGAHALSESALRARLTFKDSGAVDDTEVSTNAREIEAAYRESGYRFVQVASAFRVDAEHNVIRYSVTEGPRVIVDAITFSGNTAFPARALTRRMTTHAHGVLERGIFRQDVLDQDLSVLTAFYRTQGFPDVAVGPAKTEFSDDHQHAHIVIPIREGPRITVGHITVQDASVRSSEEILAAVPFSTGQPWMTQNETAAQRAIARLYAERGFLDARIAIETTRADDRMDVRIGIDEGAQTRVGRVLVSGLIATHEGVVQREIPFKPGDPFNPELLVETERRLGRLGIFERVQVGPLRPPQTPFADVDVTLREGKPWRVEFGAGYGTDRGWRGVLEVGHDNLFGSGKSASVRENLTQHGDRTDLTFRSPWVLGVRVQGDSTLFREQWQELGYKREGAGITLGVQREALRQPLSEIARLRVGLRYQLEWVRRFDIDASLLAANPNNIVPGSQIVGRITPTLTLDYRDNLLDPQRGSLHTLSVDVAGPYLGSQVSFVKSRLETAWYIDWLSPVVIALGGRVGLAGAYGNSAALPIEDRFYAGGNSTVRGYPQDKIGPLDAARNPIGGNALLIFNAEARFPIWRWLSGVAFVDTGTVAPQVRDFAATAFKTGVGTGLRVKTPVGPFRLDFGYALNEIPGQNRWQLYFGIGQAF